MKRIDIEELLVELSGIEDKRQQWGNLRHKLTDILFIILCAIMCGMEDIDGIAIFGEERQEWLRKYIEMKNGAPSYATYERVLRMLEPKEIRFEPVNLYYEVLRDYIEKAEKGGVDRHDQDTEEPDEAGQGAV